MSVVKPILVVSFGINLLVFILGTAGLRNTEKLDFPVCLSICLSNCLFVCLIVCLSVSLFANFFRLYGKFVLFPFKVFTFNVVFLYVKLWLVIL